MRILKYRCQARGTEDWDFSEIEFQKLNLLVGDTATGKTRLLNTIFNVGAFVASDDFKSGYWQMTFSQADATYRWILEAEAAAVPSESRIVREDLVLIESKHETELIRRTPDLFTFQGQALPKLSPRASALSLLKEEEAIRPVHDGFAAIKRRRFFAEALSDAAKLETIAPDLVKRFDDRASQDELYRIDLGLNATLYLMSRVSRGLAGLRTTSRKAACALGSTR